MWLVSAELPRAAMPMTPMPAATTPAAPTAVRILVLIPRSPHQAVRLLGDVSIGVRGAAVMAVLQEWNGMRGEWGLRRAEWTELSRSDTCGGGHRKVKAFSARTVPNCSVSRAS